MATFRYQHRRGTTESCNNCTDIPKDGELIVEKCDGGAVKIKIGDGEKLYPQLPYVARSDMESVSGSINTIKVNGTIQPIQDKTVDIAVPIYSAATTSAAGLMSAEDKVKLDETKVKIAIENTTSAKQIYDWMQDGYAVFFIANYFDSYIFMQCVGAVLTDSEEISCLFSTTYSITDHDTDEVCAISLSFELSGLSDGTATNWDAALDYNPLQVDNLVTSISSSSDDTHYPSAKAVYDAIPKTIATTSDNGLMSKEDKTKLDGIATGANKYSLPTASASTLGGVKVGTNLSISNGVLSATDTTYSNATTSAAGLMSAADKTSLNGKADLSGAIFTGDIQTSYGEVKSFKAVKQSYTNGATWYYPICKLPINNSSNYTSIILNGRLGGWLSGDMASFSALCWNRAGTGFSGWILPGTGVPSVSFNLVNPQLYIQDDNTAILYLKCYDYFAFDINVSIYQSNVVKLWDGSYTDTPTGTADKLFSIYAKNLKNYDYNDLANKPGAYSLPTASSSTLGGIKVGAGLSISDGVLSASSGGVADSVDWNNIQNKPNTFTPATHAHSYNDLTNKPATVTESTVSGWGFTKNTGTYSKPSSGIPKTDLASDVQTSLGKADSALQSHQDISGKEDKSNKVSSWSATPNDTNYPSEKLVKDALDGKQAAGSYASSSHTHATATSSANGLMSSTDKSKLDGISAGANNYSLPTASSSVLGGVKVGTNLSISNGVLSAIDTTYSVATTSSNGLMSFTDKTKLNQLNVYVSSWNSSTGTLNLTSIT